MSEHLRWEDVDAAMDAVEEGDTPAILSVYWTYEGRATDRLDGRGARQTVNIATFCGRYGLYRNTFRAWLRKYRHIIEPSAQETA